LSEAALPLSRATAGRELRTRGKRTVRKLLDAGIETLATKGFHDTRVDDVVQAADISHGTFYLYFANKDDLFRALLLDVGETMGEHARSLGSLTADAAGREELRRWLAGFVAAYRAHAPVIRAWVEAEIDTHGFGELGAEVLGGYAGILTERIAGAPGIRTADPASAALVVVAMIERATYYRMVGPIRTSDDDLVDTLAAVIHAALFGAPA
jgi:AcrR family transcriptional regulator